MGNDLKVRDKTPIDVLPNPFAEILTEDGYDIKQFVLDLAKKTKATKPNSVKMKGQVDESTLKNGARVLAVSKKHEVDKDGAVYDDGETIIQWDEPDERLQFEALKTLVEDCGLKPPEQKANQYGNVQIQIINYNGEEPKKIE